MFILKSFNVQFRPIIREYARFTRRNAGVQGRKKLMQLDESELESLDLEDVETDFMDVHKSHKDYEFEKKMQKEHEKLMIIGQKYFKEEKSPNFLTWHDKEQIKYLYRTNPEEWSIERLSDGFPALPGTIKKLIKGNWTKDKQHKITNHDVAVQKNWELLKKGHFQDLPEELKHHLKKFTDRSLNLKPFKLPETETRIVLKTKKTDFSDIITSYQKIKQKGVPLTEDTKNNERITDQKQRPLEETYTLSKNNKKELITFSELRNSVQEKIKSSQKIDDEDKLIALNFKTEVGRPEHVGKPEIQFNSSAAEVTLHKSTTETDLSFLQYPEKILIPKNIRKRGYTYRLYDCYYDDNGEFLYRVPGMG